MEFENKTVVKFSLLDKRGKECGGEKNLFLQAGLEEASRTNRCVRLSCDVHDSFRSTRFRIHTKGDDHCQSNWVYLESLENNINNQSAYLQFDPETRQLSWAWIDPCKADEKRFLFFLKKVEEKCFDAVRILHCDGHDVIRTLCVNRETQQLILQEEGVDKDCVCAAEWKVHVKCVPFLADATVTLIIVFILVILLAILIWWLVRRYRMSEGIKMKKNIVLTHA